VCTDMPGDVELQAPEAVVEVFCLQVRFHRPPPRAPSERPPAAPARTMTHVWCVCSGVGLQARNLPEVESVSARAAVRSGPTMPWSLCGARGGGGRGGGGGGGGGAEMMLRDHETSQSQDETRSRTSRGHLA
jgi:hypothetical protein